MRMEAVKAALEDLLAAMDAEDKRVLQDKLAGPKESAPEAEVEEKSAMCEDCGTEPCSCGESEEE